MGDDDLVLFGERGQGPDGPGRIGLLDFGIRLLPALEQGVPADGDDDAHLAQASPQSPRVATMTALIVCMRFSAWSKTIEYGDSKTSSVTSSASIPV